MEFISKQSLAVKVVSGIVLALLLIVMVRSCSAPAYAPVAAAPAVVAPVQAAPPVTVVNGGSHGSDNSLVNSMVGGAIGGYIGGKLAQPSQPSYAPGYQQRSYPTTTAPVHRYVQPTTVTRSTNSRGVTTTVTSRPSGRQSISVGSTSSSRPSTTRR